MADLQAVIFPPSAPTVVIMSQDQGSVIVVDASASSVIIPPQQGYTVITEQSGAAGVSPSAFYDISFNLNTMPVDTNPFFELLPVRTFYYPAGLTGSRFYARTTATDGPAVFTLKKNGTSIGTVTFAIGANTPTISFASQVNFTTSDKLSMFPPYPADSTLAGVDISLAGIR